EKSLATRADPPLLNRLLKIDESARANNWRKLNAAFQDVCVPLAYPKHSRRSQRSSTDSADYRSGLLRRTRTPLKNLWIKRAQNVTAIGGRASCQSVLCS